MTISLTKEVIPLVEKILKDAEKLKVLIKKVDEATIIDCGINAEGSFTVGLLYAKISLGGLAKVRLNLPLAEDKPLLTVQVATSYPVLSTLGCQAASWNISKGEFFGMVCGPGRALAQKPSKIYKLLDYQDENEKAILCIESDQLPNKEVIQYLAEKCHVEKKNLIILMIKTACLVEYVQMAARAVELGMFKLVEQMGYPRERILHAVGSGIIPPISLDTDISNDRVNNALIYGTKLYLIVGSEKDDNLPELIKKIPSNASSSYGKKFLELFNEAGQDFANFDLSLLAPTELIVNDIRTGKIYHEGKINKELLID
jgi:methenyltetrahydromethanopterin cyclohydrolase